MPGLCGTSWPANIGPVQLVNADCRGLASVLVTTVMVQLNNVQATQSLVAAECISAWVIGGWLSTDNAIQEPGSWPTEVWHAHGVSPRSLSSPAVAVLQKHQRCSGVRYVGSMSPSTLLIQAMQPLSRYLLTQSLSITRTRYIASFKKWPRKVLSDLAAAHGVPKDNGEIRICVDFVQLTKSQREIHTQSQELMDPSRR